MGNCQNKLPADFDMGQLQCCKGDTRMHHQASFNFDESDSEIMSNQSLMENSSILDNDSEGDQMNVKVTVKHKQLKCAQSPSQDPLDIQQNYKQNAKELNLDIPETFAAQIKQKSKIEHLIKKKPLEIQKVIDSLPQLKKQQAWYSDKNIKRLLQKKEYYYVLPTDTDIGYVYRGTWVKAKPMGYGEIFFYTQTGLNIKNKFSLNIYYKGEVNEGKANGYGRMIQKDGTVYEGEFKDNKFHGQGKIKKPSGFEYDGDFVDGEQEGYGIETWPNGTVYRGEFLKGQKNGEGKFDWVVYFVKHDLYWGLFRNNKFNGFGIYTWHDGRKYTGQWYGGKMNGYGEFIWPNGCRYQGYYKEDIKHGYGILYQPTHTEENPLFWEGNWSNGKQSKHVDKHKSSEEVHVQGYTIKGDYAYPDIWHHKMIKNKKVFVKTRGQQILYDQQLKHKIDIQRQSVKEHYEQFTQLNLQTITGNEQKSVDTTPMANQLVGQTQLRSQNKSNDSQQKASQLVGKQDDQTVRKDQNLSNSSQQAQQLIGKQDQHKGLNDDQEEEQEQEEQKVQQNSNQQVQQTQNTTYQQDNLMNLQGIQQPANNNNNPQEDIFKKQPQYADEQPNQGTKQKNPSQNNPFLDDSPEKDKPEPLKESNKPQQSQPEILKESNKPQQSQPEILKESNKSQPKVQEEIKKESQKSLQQQQSQQNQEIQNEEIKPAQTQQQVPVKAQALPEDPKDINTDQQLQQQEQQEQQYSKKQSNFFQRAGEAEQQKQSQTHLQKDQHIDDSQQQQHHHDVHISEEKKKRIREKRDELLKKEQQQQQEQKNIDNVIQQQLQNEQDFNNQQQKEQSDLQILPYSPEKQSSNKQSEPILFESL